MITITNEDNLDLFKRVANKSVDIICIDPPYLYLKNQKLERIFDENLFFQQCYRVLKQNGFIIMFGRGISFYRWCGILDKLGLDFKEEIVWDKGYTSSPMGALSRTHETISIFGKGKAKIATSRIPYVEQKDFNFDGIQQDIKRIKSALNNPKSLSALEKYIASGEIGYSLDKRQGSGITITGALYEQDRAVKTLQTITVGLKEKSVIRLNRQHYGTIHPTQKPVRLLERLLMLCLPVDQQIITIADFFGGSFSTMEACINLQEKLPSNEFTGISCEIDKEYFDAGKERIEKILLKELY